MEEKRTVFNLIFKDKEYCDWYITLYTTEPKTEKDILNLIEYYGEMNARNFGDYSYSPCDIMDDMCDNNDGWYWTDWNIEIVTVQDWN